MTKLLLLFAIIMAAEALSAAGKTKKCGKNAVHVPCANECVATCQLPNPQLCVIAADACRAGCKCKEGHVLNRGRCVPASSCPAAKGSEVCTKNEVHNFCANACVPTCRNPNPRGCMISPEFCRPGCKCEDGHVLKGGQCIPASDCPDEINPRGI